MYTKTPEKQVFSWLDKSNQRRQSKLYWSGRKQLKVAAGELHTFSSAMRLIHRLLHNPCPIIIIACPAPSSNTYFKNHYQIIHGYLSFLCTECCENIARLECYEDFLNWVAVYTHWTVHSYSLFSASKMNARLYLTLQRNLWWNPLQIKGSANIFPVKDWVCRQRDDIVKLPTRFLAIPF